MKQFKLTFVLTVLMSMVGLKAFADIYVDGLYYNLDYDNNWAQVTSNPSGEYTGDIIIPSSITDNDISYSVTKIGNSAFLGCSGLTSVTIPNSVTGIGDDAFKDCTGLTSAIIPNSVTSIGWSAFSNCSGLTSAIILNSVVYIGSSAFSNCSGLTSVTIGGSVKSLGRSTFSNCSGLTSFTIPNSVTMIDDYAFAGCSGLTSITIPSSVTGTGERAFSKCSGLTSVTIGSSVTYIGDYAFEDCTGLTSVTIPNSVTSIYFNAFDGCSGLTSITIGNSVKSIGKYAFSDCSALTSITIPNSVTSIGENAFRRCSALTSITIGSSVTSIGENVFSGCSSLTSIKVESENTKYDSRENCNAIIETASNTLVFGCQTTVIPNSVTSIGQNSFNGCTGLTSITIPNSVKSIDDRAFYECSGLKSVDIGNSVKSIGKYAFSDCSALTSITIPNSVTSIGDWAFNSCTGLSSFRFPSQLETLSADVLRDCNVKRIIIPASVRTIEARAFFRCNSLQDVYCLAKDVPTTHYLTFYDLNTKQVTLHVYSESVNKYSSANVWKKLKQVVALTSDEISALKSGCFPAVEVDGLYYYLSLDNHASVTSEPSGKYTGDITIPASFTYKNKEYSVVSIENEAFNNCSSLTSVVIPSSVTSIGANAFSGSSSLTSITVLNPTPVAISDNVFTNRTNATLYVPIGSKEAYLAADYWKEFKEIIEKDFTGIDQIMIDGQNNAKIFTLDGKRINKPRKGINIIGGKKVLVK